MEGRITIGRLARRVAYYALVFGGVGPIVGAAFLALPLIVYPPFYLAALTVSLLLTFPWPSMVGMVAAFLPKRGSTAYLAAAIAGAFGGYGIFLTMPVYWPEIAHEINYRLTLLPLSAIAATVSFWLAQRVECWIEGTFLGSRSTG